MKKISLIIFLILIFLSVISYNYLKKGITYDIYSLKEMFIEKFPELEQKNEIGLNNINIINQIDHKGNKETIFQIVWNSKNKDTMSLYKSVISYYFSIIENNPEILDNLTSFAFVVGYGNDMKNPKTIMIGSKILKSKKYYKEKDFNRLLPLLRKECSKTDPSSKKSNYCMVRF